MVLNFCVRERVCEGKIGDGVLVLQGAVLEAQHELFLLHLQFKSFDIASFPGNVCSWAFLLKAEVPTGVENQELQIRHS